MKKLLFIAFLFNILFANNDLVYTIGVSVENNDYRMIKDVRLGFGKIFNNSKVGEKKLKVKFYDNAKKLISDFTKNEKIDILTIQGLNYLKNSTEIKNNADTIFIIRDSENDYKQYYFIANKNSNINSIKDIKDKRLALYFENYMIQVWLDKLSLQSNKRSYKTLIKEETKKKTESLAILDVYFKKSDFAIISRLAWETMIELNPSLVKKVKIVQKSEKIFFFSVAFLKKKKNKELEKVFLRITKEEKFKSKINQLLMLAKAHSMEIKDKNYLNKIENFYKEYLELKKRYNK